MYSRQRFFYFSRGATPTRAPSRMGYAHYPGVPPAYLAASAYPPAPGYSMTPTQHLFYNPYQQNVPHQKVGPLHKLRLQVRSLYELIEMQYKRDLTW